MEVTDVINALAPFQNGLLALFGAACAVMLTERVIIWFHWSTRDYRDGSGEVD